jgi:hypothetical protein
MAVEHMEMCTKKDWAISTLLRLQQRTETFAGLGQGKSNVSTHKNLAEDDEYHERTSWLPPPPCPFLADFIIDQTARLTMPGFTAMTA